MLDFLLLLAAFILFTVAALVHRAGNGWLVPAGLACAVAVPLFDRLTAL